MDILRQVIKPAIQHLSKLVDPQNMQTAQDQVWKNDFCRFSDAVKSALYSIAGLIRLPPPAKRGQAVSDYGWVIHDNSLLPCHDVLIGIACFQR